MAAAAVATLTDGIRIIKSLRISLLNDPDIRALRDASELGRHIRRLACLRVLRPLLIWNVNWHCQIERRHCQAKLSQISSSMLACGMNCCRTSVARHWGSTQPTDKLPSKCQTSEIGKRLSKCFGMIACHLLYTPTCGMRHMACGIWHVACHSHVVRISKKLNKYNNLKRKYAKSIAAASETFHNITKWHRRRRVMRSRAVSAGGSWHKLFLIKINLTKASDQFEWFVATKCYRTRGQPSPAAEVKCGHRRWTPA